MVLVVYHIGQGSFKGINLKTTNIISKAVHIISFSDLKSMEGISATHQSSCPML